MKHWFYFAIPSGADLAQRERVLPHILEQYGVDGLYAGAVEFVGARDYGRLYRIRYERAAR